MKAYFLNWIKVGVSLEKFWWNRDSSPFASQLMYFFSFRVVSQPHYIVIVFDCGRTNMFVSL